MSHKTKRKNSSRQHSRKQLTSIVIAIVIAIVGMVFIFLQPLSIESTATDNNLEANCYWNWAYGEVLPQYMDIMHTAITDSGYANYELTASAYGEDYVCMNGDQITSSQFHLMDITPTIILPVTSNVLTSPSDLGAHIRLIVNAILSATNQLPKVRQIEIQFTHNDTTIHWSLALSELPNGIPLGMTDQGLFELGQQ